jgi:tetratricopeptide (TPR) repeat protein
MSSVRSERGAVRPALVLIAGAFGAVVLAALSLVRVPDGVTVIRSWRGGGTPDLLPQGLAWRIPVLQSIERFPGGAVSVQGRAEAASREGTDVGLPFEATARPAPQDLLRLCRAGGNQGARGALLALLSAALKQQASAAGTYDLASGAARPLLEARLREVLAGEIGPGLDITIGQPEVSPAVRASFEREAIFGRRSDTGVQLLLIGLDGADWDVIDPMIAAGELPHLSRLKREGVWARLRSSVPSLSPLLWTTVATGKSPDRHGINDFLVLDPSTKRRVPINSTFRRVRAFWNILSEAGLPVDVVAWWATWPAEPIKGRMVSDRVAYSTFNLSTLEARAGAVHPPAYGAKVDALRLRQEGISYRQVARFLKVGEDEFRSARAAGAGGRPPTERQESINVFVRVLAATETYRRIALDLLDKEQPGARLFAVYFQGIDEVNHRFAHCSPPKTPLCSEKDYASFRGAVAEFYRYQDGIVGEIMDRLPRATTLLLSDHGFASGAGRPDDVKPFIEGKPGLWHDITGIFIARGPAVGRGQAPPVTLYDIAPTLLYLLGLPVAEDMPGKILDKVVAKDFLAAHRVERVPSFEGLGPPAGGEDAGEERRAAAASGGGEEEMVEQLRSLGYIGGPEPEAGAAPGAAGPATGPPSAEASRIPAGSLGGAPAGTGPPAGAAAGGVPMLLYNTNLATVHLGKRQYDLAEAEFLKALAIDRNAQPALIGLAGVYEVKGEPERALEILRGVVHSDPVYAPGRLTKMAGLFVRLGRAEDGIAYFESLKGEGGHWEEGRQTALGVVYAAAQRPRDAERALKQALGIDASCVPAMQELFVLYDGQGRAAELEPLLRKGLRKEPQSGMFHNWLGLVLKRAGRMRDAEMAFRHTLEAAPDLIGAMANLGGLYLQEGRATEAVAVLTSAVEKDPRNMESRANLIVGLGLEKNLDAAREQLEAAEALGQRAPELYNALAYALHVNGRQEEALEALGRSLALAPQQADALRLQREIERGARVPGTAYR